MKKLVETVLVSGSIALIVLLIASLLSGCQTYNQRRADLYYRQYEDGQMSTYEYNTLMIDVQENHRNRVRRVADSFRKIGDSLKSRPNYPSYNYR